MGILTWLTRKDLDTRLGEQGLSQTGANFVVPTSGNPDIGQWPRQNASYTANSGPGAFEPAGTIVYDGADPTSKATDVRPPAYHNPVLDKYHNIVIKLLDH